MKKLNRDLPNIKEFGAAITALDRADPTGRRGAFGEAVEMYQHLTNLLLAGVVAVTHIRFHKKRQDLEGSRREIVFGSRLLFSALVGLAFLGLAGTAQSDTITHEFIGVTTESGAVHGETLSIGVPVSGVFKYDLSSPPIFDNGKVARYPQTITDGFSIDFGTATFTATEYDILMFNNGGSPLALRDAFRISMPIGFGSDNMTINLATTDLNTLSSTGLPSFIDSRLLDQNITNTGFEGNPNQLGDRQNVVGFLIESLTLRPDFLTVSIDIKPNSDQNTINLGSAGVIPVAILGSETFDATTVDETTIFLAGASVKLAGRSGEFSCQERDVNNDDYVDLRCEVETAEFMIEVGSDTAELTAMTFDGTPIKGTDSIRIVPD